MAVTDKMGLKNDMESPMNAQKDSGEKGPAIPTGLPSWPVKDPLGVVPPGGDKE